MDKNTISHDPFIDLISNGVKYLVKCWVYNYYHMFLRLLTMQLSKEIRIENCHSCFVTNPNSCQILSASILLLMQWTVHWSKTEVKSRQCNSYKTAFHRWWPSSPTTLWSIIDNEMPKGSMWSSVLLPQLLLNFYDSYVVFGAAAPKGAMSCLANDLEWRPYR